MNKFGSEKIFGIDVFSGEYGEFCDLVIDEAAKLKRRTVFTPNSDFIVRANHDKEFREVLKRSDFIVADGYPLVLAHRMKNFLFHCSSQKPLQRITGSSLTYDLSLKAVRLGLRVAFVGGDKGVAEKAASKILSESNGGGHNVMTYFPPFGFESKVDENKFVINAINDFRPHLLFVGLGSPKQENWIDKYKRSMDFGVAFGVGASFDFIAGTKARAPAWIQNVGMEWVWRLLQEPRRLGKRYFSLMPVFFVLFLKEVTLRSKR
ncbi:WecB/TagA/CpsF family glycosyltransferase [Halomonas stenophila]|uniref:N-acetylglucosaminyldiphosphoundecaprenol N-acetyl-beta-D-mannosaminyltransferase n=1 Tax=Halomonas stenophila TaxID=795312 RepID=A0A7W5ESB5_9GAMM|nr:N-acetylglucosaminyldiphosphoundecaprenol N-acetyl-beta-D-mannosaminyltransferase [Halomonas stenophila]